ncbi:hypothetical protein MAHJHV58_48490 [Mycobacterium avium subsp. hominissuis]|uniref:Fic/DOC family protein n=1 Tax=Mycobacterium avium TaxID=1764 RepID=UPI000BAF3D4E|nr:Fic family protein [Mycobacterium avium]PBA38792.1 cell filamentation protein Fic [Mycobacterium avium]PBA78703.1 cell filamentation protein Fic [Mycobacterium avium]
MNDYRRWEDYFWPDTPEVLRNRLGIRDQRMLNFVESQLSAVRIAETVLENRTGAFDFARYCDTHRRLFSDVYDWAGQPRTVPEGPMTKPGRDVVNFLLNDPAAPTVTYRYRPGPQVRDGAQYLFDRLTAEDALTGLGPRDFVDRLGTYWGAIDSVHPFREGNTRTEVVFFHSLASNAGYDLGAEQLHARRDEFLAARFHGHATGGYQRLKALLASTVEARDTQELSARERRWAMGLLREAEQNADLIRRVHDPRPREQGPGLEL